MLGRFGIRVLDTERERLLIVDFLYLKAREQMLWAPACSIVQDMLASLVLHWSYRANVATN